MKMRKFSKLATAFITVGLLLASCGGASKSDVQQIGILQLAEHASLDDARKGFIEELAANGYIDGENIQINIQNAQGDQANLKSMSEKLVNNSDLLFGIATPAAQALANETSEKPIIFTAVTDAVAAGLVTSDTVPGGNITGTSDMAPVVAQIALLKSIRPETKKVGIIFNSSEYNSQVQADIAKAELERLGMEAVIQTVTTTNDVQSATESLVKQVEAIYVPTDNTLAASMTTVRAITIPTNTIVITGSVGDATAGGLATFGIDYTSLGRQAALQAIQVLEGKVTPAALPVETATQLTLFVNEDVAAALNIDPSSIVAPTVS